MGGVWKLRFLAVVACLLGTVVFTAPASATNWVVAGVSRAPVREYVGGPILFTVKAGTVVALTGRCTRRLTLERLSQLSLWHQRKLMARHWCETEPLLDSKGWIFGGFLVPE